MNYVARCCTLGAKNLDSNRDCYLALRPWISLLTFRKVSFLIRATGGPIKNGPRHTHVHAKQVNFWPTGGEEEGYISVLMHKVMLWEVVKFEEMKSCLLVESSLGRIWKTGPCSHWGWEKLNLSKDLLPEVKIPVALVYGARMTEASKTKRQMDTPGRWILCGPKGALRN